MKPRWRLRRSDPLAACAPCVVRVREQLCSVRAYPGAAVPCDDLARCARLWQPVRGRNAKDVASIQIQASPVAVGRLLSSAHDHEEPFHLGTWRELYQEAISAYWDDEAHEGALRREEAERQVLRDMLAAM